MAAGLSTSFPFRSSTTRTPPALIPRRLRMDAGRGSCPLPETTIFSFIEHLQSDIPECSLTDIPYLCNQWLLESGYARPVPPFQTKGMRRSSDTAPLAIWTQTGHMPPTMDSISFNRNNLEDFTFGPGRNPGQRKGNFLSGNGQGRSRSQVVRMERARWKTLRGSQRARSEAPSWPGKKSQFGKWQCYRVRPQGKRRVARMDDIPFFRPAAEVLPERLDVPGHRTVGSRGHPHLEGNHLSTGFYYQIDFNSGRCPPEIELGRLSPPHKASHHLAD